MTIRLGCDGCDIELTGATVCRGRVQTVNGDDKITRDYELCRKCMELMRGAFNPRAWPRFDGLVSER